MIRGNNYKIKCFAEVNMNMNKNKISMFIKTILFAL